jgi:hypothetical protein
MQSRILRYPETETGWDTFFFHIKFSLYDDPFLKILTKFDLGVCDSECACCHATSRLKSRTMIT